MARTTELTEAIVQQLGARGVAVIDGAFGTGFALACRADGERRRADGELRPGEISTGLSQAARAPARDDHITWLMRPARTASLAGADQPALDQLVLRLEELRGALDERCCRDTAPNAATAATAATMPPTPPPAALLDSPSFMLACYPGSGARYVRHRDAAPSSRPGRKLTLLYYLNPAWETAHGGQLRIWPLHAADCGGVDGGAASSATRSASEDMQSEEQSPAASFDLEGLLHAVRASSEREGKSAAEGAGAGAGAGIGDEKGCLVLEPVIDRLVCFLSPLLHEVLPSFAVPRFTVTAWLANRRDLALELFAEELAAKKAAAATWTDGDSDGDDTGGLDTAGGATAAAEAATTDAEAAVEATAGATNAQRGADLQKMMMRAALLKTMKAAREKCAAASKVGHIGEDDGAGERVAAVDAATPAVRARDHGRALALRMAMSQMRTNTRRTQQ